MKRNCISNACILLAAIAGAGCSKVDYDHKALGFGDKAEMEAAFAKGYHTKQKLTEMAPKESPAQTSKIAGNDARSSDSAEKTGKSEDSSGNRDSFINEQPKSILGVGEYRYSEDREKDVNCQGSKAWTCVSSDEFKKLCASAVDLTIKGSKSIITNDVAVRDKGALYLLENGAKAVFSISWNDGAKYVRHSCTATLMIEGLFEGSQYKKIFKHHVKGFVIGEDGKVWVHDTFAIY